MTNKLPLIFILSDFFPQYFDSIHLKFLPEYFVFFEVNLNDTVFKILFSKCSLLLCANVLDFMCR
jgi:hypothetical protein